MNLWELNAEVFAICQTAEKCAIPFGFHVALGGSTLHSGKSAKDLDLIFYTQAAQIIFGEFANLNFK